MTPAALAKLLGPLRRRVALMVERAVVHLVNDALKMQGLQIGVLADEERDNVERYQEYGFTSVPLAGAEAIVAALGGTRNRAVVIAVDDRRYRKKDLAPGEVALYTDEGDYVILKRGRIVEVKAGTKLRVDAPLAELTGNCTIAGTLTVTGNITGQAAIAATGNITTQAGMTAQGNVTAVGDVRDQNGAKSMAGMRATYDGHFHADAQGGTTGLPSATM